MTEEISPSLFIRCGCGAETDVQKALNTGRFFRSPMTERLYAEVKWGCSGCVKQLGFTVESAERVRSDFATALIDRDRGPDMDLVRQVVYQTKKAIQAGRTRFSFGYYGHGGVVEISPTGDGSK